MKKNDTFSGSKINQLVIRGLMAEDQEQFINRLSMIISRGHPEILSQLAEGTILSVKIIDEGAAKDWIKQRFGNNASEYVINTVSVEPSSDGTSVYVRYSYTRTRWFDSEEKVDRFCRGYGEDGTREMDEKHQFKGAYESSSSDTTSPSDKDWLDTEIF